MQRKNQLSILNPIENIFGIIKKFMKKNLLHTFELKWGEKTAARQSILDEAFIRASSQSTQITLQNTYLHMRKYLALALDGQ